jgi:opacity protein-like surface antigen
VKLARHLFGQIAIIALLIPLLALPATAQEPRHQLDGPFAGIVAGHMQTGSTVKFQGSGQINDVSGNTILPGVILGWSRANPDGLFYGVDVWGTWATEPYPSTIVQFAGREYLVERTWEVAAMGRLGYAFGTYAAAYGAAGIAAAGVTYTIDGNRQPRILWQPSFGVGVEVAVAENASLRGDWRFDWVKQDLGPVVVEYEFRTTASAALVWRF